MPHLGSKVQGVGLMKGWMAEISSFQVGHLVLIHVAVNESLIDASRSSCTRITYRDALRCDMIKISCECCNLAGFVRETPELCMHGSRNTTCHHAKIHALLVSSTTGVPPSCICMVIDTIRVNVQMRALLWQSLVRARWDRRNARPAFRISVAI